MDGRGNAGSAAAGKGRSEAARRGRSSGRSRSDARDEVRGGVGSAGMELRPGSAPGGGIGVDGAAAALQARIDEQLAAVRSALAGSIADFQSAIGERMSGVERSQAMADERLATAVERIDAVEQRMDLEYRNAQLAQNELVTRMARIEDEMALSRATAAGAGAPPPAPPEWDRALDPAVVRISTEHVHPTADVEAFVQSLIDGADIAGCGVVMSGPPLGDRRFAVRFAGEPRAAARRAAQLLASVRTDTGGWRPLHIDTAGGAQSRVYLGEDKCLAQIRLEMATKRLATIISTRLSGGERVVPLRKDGVVSVDWQKVARVTVYREAPPTIAWNRALSTAWCASTAARSPASWPPHLRRRPTSAGSPSVLGEQRRLRIATWNAGVLLQARRRPRHRRVARLTAIARAADVVAVQELRGSSVEAARVMRHLESPHRIFISCTPGCDAGGVALLVRRDVAHCEATWTANEMVVGRVLRVRVRRDAAVMEYWCIHNFGLAAADLGKVQRGLSAAIRRDARDPVRCVTYVMGD